jgi:alpha-tubulin suppressor-like RCC1 family protein
LGDNTTTQRANPIDVIGLSSGVSAVSAGYNHTCAVLTSAEVKCWGNNNNGQLGDGTTTPRRTPVSVLTAPGGPALSGIGNVSAGGFVTCALTTVAGAKCWGGNASGNLGDGTLFMRYTAVDVLVAPGGAPLSDVSKVITYGHSCALTTSGGVKCWGNNSYGQLGDGTNINRYNPVDLTFKIPKRSASLLLLQVPAMAPVLPYWLQPPLALL